MAKNNQTFHIRGQVDLDINQVENAAKKIRSSFQSVETSISLDKALNKSLNDVVTQIDAVKKVMDKTFTSNKEVKEAEKEMIKLSSAYSDLSIAMEKVKKSNKGITYDSQLGEQVRDMEKAIASSKDLTNNFTKLAASFKQASGLKLDVSKMLDIANSGLDEKTISSQLTKAFASIKGQNTKINAVSAEDIQEIEKLKSGLKVLSEEYNEAKSKKEALAKVKSTELEDTENFKKASAIVESYSREIKNTEEAIQSFSNKEVVRNDNLQKLNTMKEVLEEISSLGSIDELQKELDTLNASKVEVLDSELQEMETNVNQIGASIRTNLVPGFNSLKASANGITTLNNEMDSIKSNMLHFFSLTNGWDLFRRGVASAANTIKELDAAMTEIAVVTDMSLDEVWSGRMDYSQNATELGAATIDMVNASKLYYQQGLSQVEVTEAATETVKMARIANIDGAQATDLMTAAVRGFNMEMTDATMINDTYSWLAAKTAADTEEIATAMTKTASIAHSAGAEFQTTSAFLAQMIETTREAPENIGTALKTIIARFQELKEDPVGLVEVDGETVDANAIEKALRSVDIALRDVNGEFRDFDDVIMEISSKWDTMSVMQQRYIATTAAGSRQQSRFIALVQDNARQMELVKGATMSSGSANEQYEKTLESWESKVNKLKNAWDIFLTSIADNETLKLGIDVLTMFLETINDITGSLPGLSKSIGTMALTFGAFKGVSKIVTSSLEAVGASLLSGAGISKDAEAGGAKAANNFKSGFDRILLKYNPLKSLQIDPSSMEYAGAAGALLGEGYTKSAAGAKDYSKTIQLLNTKKIVEVGLAKENLKYLTLEEVATLRNATADKVEAVATDLKTKAQQRENMSKVTGFRATLLFLTSSGKLIVAKALETKVLGANTVAWKANAKAQQTAAIAGMGSLGPLLLVAAGVVALSYAFSAIKSYQEGLITTSEQLAEQLNEMNNAASLASEALVAIGEDRSALEDLEDTLDSLTEGTIEWKEALIEVNDKVIELINKYPDLLGYVDTANNGVMSVSDEGFEKVLEDQQKAVENATNSQNVIRQQMSTVGVMEQAKSLNSTSTSNHSLLNDEELAQIALNFYNSGGSMQMSADELEAALYNAYTKATGEYRESDFDDLKEIATSSPEAFEQLGSDIKASGLEVSKLNNEFISNVAIASEGLERFTDDISNTEDARIFDAAQGAVVNGESVDISSEVQDRIKNGWLDDGIDGGSEAVQKQYAELANITQDEVERQLEAKEISEDTIALAVATNEVEKEYQKQMEKGAKILESFNNSTNESQKALVGLTSVEQVGIKQSDIDAILSAFDVGSVSELSEQDLDMESIAKALDTDVALLEGLGYENVDEFVSALEMGSKRIDTALSGLNALDTDGIVVNSDEFQNIIKNQSAGSIEGFSKIIENAYIASGKDGANLLVEMTNDIFKDLDVEEQEKLIYALNSLDVKNVKSIEGLSEELKNLGIDLPISEVNALEGALIGMGEATENLSFEDLKTELIGLSDILDNLTERGANDRTFSQEEYDALIGSGAATEEDFIFDGSEWVYLGSIINDLIPNVEKNTSALLANTKAELETKIDLGNATEEAMQQERFVGLETDFANGALSEEQMRDFLTSAYVNTPEDQRENLSYTKESLSNLDQEQLTNIMSQMLSYMQNRDANESQLQGINNSMGGIAAQSNSPQTNVAFATTPAQVQDNGQHQSIGQETIDAQQGLILQAAQYEGLGGSILKANEAQKEYEASLQTSNVELQNNKKAAADAEWANLGTSIAAAEATRRFEEYGESLQENYELLGAASKGSAEYTDILNSVSADLSGLLGFEVDSSFLEEAENLQLLEEAMTGSQSAFEQLYNNAWHAQSGIRALSEQYGFSAQEVTNVTNALDNLSFNIDGTADLTQVYEALMNAGMSAVEAAGYLEQLGATSVRFEVQGLPTFGPSLPSSGDALGMLDTIKKVAASMSNIKVVGVVSGGISGNSGVNPFSSGGAAPSSSSSSGSSGSGSGGSELSEAAEEWENAYDWLYNLVEKTNEELRTRNKLEWNYADALRTSTKYASDLYDNLEAQEDSLKRQQDYYNQQMSGRMTEQGRIEAEYSDVKKYAKYNESLGVIEINWSAIDKVTDTEEGQRIEEYIGKLEGVQSQIEEIEDAQMDIIDQLEELADLGKDEYLSLEDRLVAAIEGLKQAEIDRLSEINDSINTASANVLTGIQNGIDEQRQARQNEDALESIQEKERRLALLQQDTSGANQLDILALEKELEEERESYTDSLIDQAIQDIQDGNDVAATQREAQIDLMQAQLDYAIESGALWQEAYSYLTEAFGQGGTIEGTQLGAILEAWENTDSMSSLGKDEWLNSLNEEIKAGFSWYMNQHQLENRSDMVGQTITFTDANGKSQSGKVNSDGTITTNGMTYSDIYQAPDGTWQTVVSGKKVNTSSNTSSTSTSSSSSGTSSSSGGYFEKVTDADIRSKGLNPYSIVDALKVAIGKPTISNSALETAIGGRSVIASKNGISNYSYSAAQNNQMLGLLKQGKLKRYATGGYADYTGLAWLDGTKSRPEAVLNQDQTQAFIKFVDRMDATKDNNNKKQGDQIFYDINLNVESMSSDYDVDQLMNKLEQKISEKASYRNVNAVSRFSR